MKNLETLIEIMSRLRNPETGCPWDIKQNYASIAPHTLEEAYEVIDAIEKGDKQHLKEELGDLLFQVVFYARLGEEEGEFDFESIAAGIAEKLLRRHPHVFPNASLEEQVKAASGISSEQVVLNWEQIKSEERKSKPALNTSVLDDVPLALPALTRAAKLQKRAASAGFDWVSTTQVMAKLHEEIEELQQALSGNEPEEIKDELADVLFSVVNVARHLKLDPESLLRQGNAKFERRYRAMEQLARVKGSELGDLDITEQENLWQESKKRE